MADRTTPMPGVDSGEFAPPGILAGRYVIERELGRGATATVYLARDTKYDRLVAAKTLNRELAYALGPSRFLREIEITARLQHPNILTIHDSGEIDGLLYYVTPYLEGDTLRARLAKERQLPVDVAVRITTELADALHYAHEHGVIHRDIKPENILFSGGHACLADFGIAHAIQRAGGDRLTTTGLVLGTPAYMSPEQAAGERELDGRSDLYSLACVLYEMLAGMAPFIGPTPESVVAQRFSHTPRPIRAFRAGVPVYVEQTLSRALSITPADRYASTEEFATALTTAVAPNDQSTVSARSSRQRSWTIAGVAIGVVLTVVAATNLVRGRGQTLSESRVAILPFSGTGGRQLDAATVRQELYDAFRRWRDLDLVDPGTVAQWIASPTTDKEATAVARRLGAGKLVQASLTPSGDSIRVDAVLYDVIARRRTRVYTLVLPDARSAGSPSYRRAASALLREGDIPAGMDPGEDGTNVISAWRAYHRGVAHLRTWELEDAEAEFSKAIAADPAYAVAQLWLAQVGSWLRDNEPDSWMQPALRAVAGAPSLTERDRLLAEGVLALSRRDYQSACDSYHKLLARDSLDVTAWFGRGECLSKDRLVVRDTRSPGGWRFASSPHSGIAAFLRALEIAPDAHSVLGLGRRKGLFYATTNRIRIGRSAASDSFAASPSLDAAGDSLAFVPLPFDAFASGDPRATPPTLDRAIRRQRDIVLRLARDWVRREPNSAKAHEALAYALEVRGELGDESGHGESAVNALRRARANSKDSTQRFRLATAEVRVLLKRAEFAGVHRLADSLLRAHERPNAAMALQLAGLAALTGQARRTVQLLNLAAYAGGAAAVNGSLLGARAPERVRDAASALVAYSALGVCDSVRVVLPRLEQLIDTHIEPSGRAQVWNDVVPRALSMATPCDSGRAMLRVRDPHDRIMRMQQALARQDPTGLRAHFRTLNGSRHADRPGDIALDYTYQEAWLLAAMGDTSAARARLDQALRSLATLGDYVVEYVPQAAAVSRLIALKVRLSHRSGELASDSTWAERLQRLMASSDSPGQWVIRQ